MASYLLFKRVRNGNTFTSLYLSVTGRWVKSSGCASVHSYDVAKALSETHQCSFRGVKYPS